MKKIIWVVIVLLLGGAGYYVYINMPKPAVPQVTKEERILNASKEVLKAIGEKNYVELEKLVSVNGLSYDMYPYIDYATSDIPKEDVSDVTTDTKEYLWGYSDGKGDPVMLTRKKVIDQIVAEPKFLLAPQIAINKILGKGNSLNNIPKNVGDRDFITFYYPGFDPKYEGTDWKTLYLIFDLEDNEYKLRGYAFDYWTI